MNTFCRNLKTSKTATLCSRRPTVSSSQILFNMCVYLSDVLLPFVSPHNIGRASRFNAMQFKHPPWCSLLQTERAPIRVSQSCVTALKSLVITSTLIMVRSPFPLIWIIRIIQFKGLWCGVFSKPSLALCLQGIFDGDKFEVELRQVRVLLVNRCGARSSRF